MTQPAGWLACDAAAVRVPGPPGRAWRGRAGARHPSYPVWPAGSAFGGHAPAGAGQARAASGFRRGDGAAPECASAHGLGWASVPAVARQGVAPCRVDFSRINRKFSGGGGGAATRARDAGGQGDRRRLIYCATVSHQSMAAGVRGRPWTRDSDGVQSLPSDALVSAAACTVCSQCAKPGARWR